jgi:hypothetical protein
LGVAGARGTLVLIVGGHEAARAIAGALSRAGVGVRLWAGPQTREAARAVGLDADRGRLLVDALNREAELEEVTDALLMSRSDDFNALAAAELRAELGHGHVYRLAPHPDEPDLLTPASDADIIGDANLTLDELTRRLQAGWQLVDERLDAANGSLRGPAHSTLFAVSPNGSLRAAMRGSPPAPRGDDTVIALVAPAARA